MKLQAAKTEGQNIFTAYGDGYVSINALPRYPPRSFCWARASRPGFRTRSFYSH